MKNINRNQTLIFFIGVFLFIVFLIPFIHLYFSVRTNTRDIRKKFESLIDSNNGLYHMVLYSNSFYRYVRTNKTSTIRNNTINDEIKRLEDIIAKTQADLLKLLIYYQDEKTCSNHTRITLEHLIRGDLCTAKPLERLAMYCEDEDMPRYLLKNGIQGLNSFSLKTLANLKYKYDTSQQSENDAKLVLRDKDLNNLDVMIASFQSFGFIHLQNTVQNCTLETIAERRTGLVHSLLIYLGIFAIFIPILLTILLNRMEQERVEWRKVFRKIPLEIIRTHKVLKYRLIKESNFTIHFNPLG